MMALDNVLKATIDAIAESDNEIGGLLITRLREATGHGQDNGQTAVGFPTRLTSPVAIFQAGDVGRGLDVLQPVVGAATGNEGSFIVATFIDAQNVTLTKVDGVAAAFITQKPVRWRWTTLRVETTLDFPARDRLLQVYVGEEQRPIPYAQLVQTPGAQELRGLGPQVFEPRGSIAIAAPGTLTTLGAFFVAGDVGKAVWVLPLATPNGNQGPHRITAVAGDGKSATVTPVFTATEAAVYFVKKRYDTDEGHLSGKRGKLLGRFPLVELSEVVEGSGA
jgi:hypothetical protein